MVSKIFPLTTLALFSFGICLRGQQGLLGEYYNGKNFDQKVLTRTDARINFVWDNVAPAPGLDPNVFSVRWTGRITAPETGTYLFRAHVDDGIRVMVDGRMIINAWGMHDSELFTGEIALKAGQQYPLQVEYFNALYEGEVQLFWQLPSETPVFQGLLGYNDHPINPSLLFLPTQPKPIIQASKPGPAKVKSLQPAPPKQAAKPETRVLKPADIAKDTLEKYLPRNIHFEKSKPIMLPESKPELERLAGFLLRNPRYRLHIEGHTDHIGNADKNWILSKERAQAVADFLIQKGISGQRITTQGYGDTRPLFREAAGVINEKNRRVEFFIQE